jgi:hypothetical protein
MVADAVAEFVLGCWLAFRLRDWMVDALAWFVKTIFFLDAKAEAQG